MSLLVEAYAAFYFYILFMLLLLNWLNISKLWRYFVSLPMLCCVADNVCALDVGYSLTMEDSLKLKAAEAKEYCKKQAFNTDFCFLVDFSIHSGKKRFFIWDFQGDSVRYSSLCAHGCGGGSTHEKPVYSNIEGSHCSSLGKYKVGARSYSNWGIHVSYKLHGLEKSNNNAFKRYVVLHSYSLVPYAETYPYHLPLGISEGCPVIDNKTMKAADDLLKKVKTPVLLWIFE